MFELHLCRYTWSDIYFTDVQPQQQSSQSNNGMQGFVGKTLCLLKLF